MSAVFIGLTAGWWADCLARTWHVPDEVPAIFAAVDSASYGDTVLVAPGIYARERDKGDENGNSFWIEMKDGVTLISEGGASTVTLIDTSEWPYTYVITCDSIADAQVTGFTIVNGTHVNTGGDPALVTAIYSTGISVYASDVSIVGNVLSGFWFGIRLGGDTGAMWRPLVQGNEINDCQYGMTVSSCATICSPSLEDNVIQRAYAGVDVWNASPYLDGNVVSDCDEYGIYFRGFSQSPMVRNRIFANGSYGVYAWMDWWLYCPCLNCGGGVETANDVHGHRLYDVYYQEDTGMGLFEASCNYWGTNCPDSSQFYGRVGWTPWTDSAHQELCTDCASCGNATEPTSWGSIKAMFR